VVIAANQGRTPTGAVSAAASTLRGELGRCHSVATATSTKATPVEGAAAGETVTDGRVGGEIVAGKTAAGATAADATAAVPTAGADVRTGAAVDDDGCETAADVAADAGAGDVAGGVAADEQATSNAPTTRLSGATSRAPADRRPTIGPSY
jgi:hypothetical protein